MNHCIDDIICARVRGRILDRIDYRTRFIVLDRVSTIDIRINARVGSILDLIDERLDDRVAEDP